jgi:uncharacterized membrane protein YfcA
MEIIAAIITFIFTTLLTIAGLGAAFILVPVFMALGYDIHISMATALLLNAISMAFASYRFITHKLIIWNIAIPILIIATILSPLGAYVSQGLDKKLLIIFFIVFLLFAAANMLFYNLKPKEIKTSRKNQLITGGAIGGIAGFLGGMLGVGGGNFIVPVLVWQGIDPKKASATTSLIVIFSSLSGFLGHSSLGAMNYTLLIYTGIASVFGAIIGSWLVTDKLNKKQVKFIIGIILIIVALKMIYSLIF